MGTTLPSDGITAGFQPFYYTVRKSLATVCKHIRMYIQQSNFERKKNTSLAKLDFIGGVAFTSITVHTVHHLTL